MSLSDVKKSTFEKHALTNVFYGELAVERHGRTLRLVTWRATEAGHMAEVRTMVQPSAARQLAASLLELATAAEREGSNDE